MPVRVRLISMRNTPWRGVEVLVTAIGWPMASGEAIAAGFPPPPNLRADARRPRDRDDRTGGLGVGQGGAPPRARAVDPRRDRPRPRHPPRASARAATG